MNLNTSFQNGYSTADIAFQYFFTVIQELQARGQITTTKDLFKTYNWVCEAAFYHPNLRCADELRYALVPSRRAVLRQLIDELFDLDIPDAQAENARLAAAFRELYEDNDDYQARSASADD